MHKAAKARVDNTLMRDMVVESTRKGRKETTNRKGSIMKAKSSVSVSDAKECRGGECKRKEMIDEESL